jgi:hypothetical protein
LYLFHGFGTLLPDAVATAAQRAGVARSSDEWLELFEMCFTHGAQRVPPLSARTARDDRRKSMSAMLERVRHPGTYQAFQHFITGAPWSVDAVW